MKRLFWQILSLLIPLLFGISSNARADNQVTLVFAGDAMLGRLVDTSFTQHSPAYYWGNTRGFFRGADVSFVNQEFVFTKSNKKWNETRKAFHFKAHPRVVSVFKSAGIDFVSIANNHSLDFGWEGLLETIKVLDKHKILHAGAGKNLQAAQKIAWLEVNNIKIAFIAFTNNMSVWKASTKPGIFYLPISKSTAPQVTKIISRAKKEGAEYIVLSVHWGPNWRDRPYQDFRNFAYAVLNAGADLIHGHSAHMINGIELYKGKPIFYNMGDVIDDYAVDPVKRNDLSYIARVSIDKATLKPLKIELFPTLISNLQVNRARDENFKIIANRLKKLSKALGTRVKEKENKLMVQID